MWECIFGISVLPPSFLIRSLHLQIRAFHSVFLLLHGLTEAYVTQLSVELTGSSSDLFASPNRETVRTFYFSFLLLAQNLSASLDLSQIFSLSLSIYLYRIFCWFEC